MFFKSLIILVCVLICTSAFAEIEIQKFKDKYYWKTEWTNTVLTELKSEQYRVGPSALLNIPVDRDDLIELHCEKYNAATYEEKSEFWLVFMSALTRAESAFNEKARGHKSLGLLQLSRLTAKNECGVSDPFVPEDNLKCGLKLIQWQLQGAPTASGKKLRSDLEGQIFGKYMFQWGPLRQNDKSGRKLLNQWFEKHLSQLKFCH